MSTTQQCKMTNAKCRGAWFLQTSALCILHSALKSRGPVVIGLAALAIGAGGDRPSLIEAARSTDRGTLRLLVQQGTNVNQTEADGTTALHWASYRDDLETAGQVIRVGATQNTRQALAGTH